MSQWSICMLFLVLSLAHPSAVESKGTEGERFFGRGSEVILMKTRADWLKVEKSNFAWVVAFYRESCGFCVLLRPEWDTAAVELKRYVRIAAVDVEKESSLASYVSSRYSFQVEGVPTIKTFVPTKTGKRPLVDTYTGERKAKAVIEFARGIMPSFAVPVKALRGEGTLEPGPVAIFFTPKTETSSMVKALASKFRDRLSVGQMTTGKSGGRELANTLSHACVASSPGLCIFYVDEASSKSGKHTVIDTYRRKLSIMSLENYLVDFVPRSRGGQGKAEKKLKKQQTASEEEEADDRDL